MADKSGAPDLQAILREAEARIGASGSLEALKAERARYLGRKGVVTQALHAIGRAPPEERAALGQALNAAKERIETLAAARREALEAAGRAKALGTHALDVTLPGLRPARGHRHPVALLEVEIIEFFRGLGFSVEDGPEVETDWHNFGALNFPPEHPARDMQDTFYIEGGQVLRTHTSPVQIRAMSGKAPPLRFIAPGRVYRHDVSPRHSAMFHQVEGFMVDETTSLADLKGVLYAFARHLFGPETELRFRASFFPFTEPSAELDFSCHVCSGRGAGCRTCAEVGWLEWGGCGMIHPVVLENCGIDPERYQGFAFGVGIDRAAMLRHGIPNIHVLWDGDVRVLEQI